jgi:carbonic anhydrase
MSQNNRVQHTLMSYLRYEICTPINAMMGYSNGTILAIDDNPIACDLLTRQLKRQGHLVTTATNANQALRLLKAISFDLILIDVIMPGVDGLELLRQLKQDDRFKHIPVIMLSALGEIESAVKCIKLGAADYLQKPLDLTLLKAKIGVYLEQRLQERQIPHSPPVNQTAVTATSNRSYSLENLVHPNRLNQLALAANLTTSPPRQPASPDAALERLLEGNQRFVDEACQNLQRSRSHLQETASEQYPFAAILGCADSRVPVEIIFDQGVGDLFVIRVAGNIASQTAIGSLEFAALVLGTPLIVVVGHSGCGAVAAAIKGEPLPGRIGSFVEDIKPAIARAKDEIGDLKENTVIANIQRQAQKLVESSILADSIQAGKLKIVGGQFDLQTGKFAIVT